MKEFKELGREEKREIVTYLGTWLDEYTNDVVYKVMDRINEIINNEMAMKLLKELHERTQKEREDFARDISYMMEYNDIGRSIRLRSLTHATSYRNVLYDLYIRDI